MFPFVILAAVAALQSEDEASAAEPCDTRSATATTIELVQAAPDEWLGKCVKLEGIRLGMRLYKDRGAALESIGAYDDSPPLHSIVILPGRRHLPDAQAASSEVLGVVGSCKVANEIVEAMAAESGDLVMVGGYCHTSLEAFVRPISVRVLSSDPVPRLTEAEVPPEHRELLDVPAGLPGLAGRLAAAERLMNALTAGDEATFTRLANPELVEELAAAAGEKREDWLVEKLRDNHEEFRKESHAAAAFKALAPLSAVPFRTFVSRTELKRLNDEGEANDQQFGDKTLLSCWCKEADCTGRWPVRWDDAENAPVRPYFCVTTDDYLLGPKEGSVVTARAEIRTLGFAEPQ